MMTDDDRRRGTKRLRHVLWLSVLVLGSGLLVIGLQMLALAAREATPLRVTALDPTLVGRFGLLHGAIAANQPVIADHNLVIIRREPEPCMPGRRTEQCDWHQIVELVPDRLELRTAGGAVAVRAWHPLAWLPALPP